MFRKLILLIVATVAIYSSAVFAVGLGHSELMSGLNQSLKAEIELLSTQDLAEYELKVTLATEAEFEKVGVDRIFLLNSIRFETVRKDDGNLVIKLSSRETIKEPFLNFVVALSYPKGRFVKEYTFLLDPPIFEEMTSSTIEKTQTSVSTQTGSVTQNRIPTKPSENVKPGFSGSTFGPVSSTDTLWRIAHKVRPNSQVSIQQTLVAIYRANPDAFAKGNINSLLRGKVLQIPDAKTISQVPHRAALQDVVMHNQQWKSGGARRIVDNSNKGSSSKVVSTEARLSLASQDKGVSVNQGVGSELNNANLADAQNALARSQEKSATLQAENDELRSRLVELLQKVEDSTSIINIADAELAALTQSQPKTEQMLGESKSSDAIGEDLTTNQTGELADNVEAEVVDTLKSEPQVIKNEKATLPKVVTLKQQKGLMDEILDSGWLLAGIAGVIGLIVFVVFWRMRKRMEEDDFQDDLVASAGAGSMDTTETFELPDVGDEMLVELDMDDSGEEIGESTDESFDPLGEADIYIAYGKFEQAESLLLESIEENPIRSDLKVKLMECYAENENKDKFETLAEDVSQAVDSQEWQEKINAMREQAWSNDVSENEDFDLPSTEDIFGDDEDDLISGIESADSEASDEAVSESESKFSLDAEDEPEVEAFNLDDDDESSDDEFSLDEIEDENEIESEDIRQDDADESESEEEFSLDDEDDFDLDMDMDLDDELADEESIDSSEAVTETFDSINDDAFKLAADPAKSDDGLELDDLNDSDLSLDDDNFNLDDEDLSFDDDDDDVDETEDEISTKLDLARAYIDMGDSEGAKEILAEVLEDGNDEQKSEAQILIEKAD